MRMTKLAAASLIAIATAARADETEEVVGRLMRIGSCSQPAFSADGKRIAFLFNITGSPQVFTVSSEGGWPTQITALEDPVTALAWSRTGEWLAIQVAPGGGMNTQIYLMKPDGSGLHRITPGGKDNNWLSGFSYDGGSVMLSSNRRSSDAMDAMIAAVPTGSSRLVAKNPGIGELSDLTRDGRLALVERMRQRGDNDLYLVSMADAGEVRATPHEGPGEFEGRFAADGRSIYLATNKDRDLIAFGRIGLDAAGKPGPSEVLASRDDAELQSFRLDDQGAKAALIWNAGGRSELQLYDLRARKALPPSKMPAEIVGGANFSHDGKKLAFVASGASSPAEIFVLDVATGDVRQVTQAPHPGVDLTSLVRPELFHFKAHDGLPLSGWLYRPRGAVGPTPYVLSFHGGPEGQERPFLRADYQALLSRGIGVFAPNVRGSSGFGKKFVNLDNGALRVNGVKDIKASHDSLVQAGIGAPGRIGVMGGSYGGYMTMAALTEFPELFAAGANLFGIVNFKTFFEHSEPWMGAISKVEYGDPDTQADLLAALSPLNKIDRVRAPTLVLHGANDTNVPVVEAEQVVASLKRRGIPVEYVLFPDEGHGFRKLPNRIRATLAVTRWFEKALAPAEQVKAIQ